MVQQILLTTQALVAFGSYTVDTLWFNSDRELPALCWDLPSFLRRLPEHLIRVRTEDEEGESLPLRIVGFR